MFKIKAVYFHKELGWISDRIGGPLVLLFNSVPDWCHNVYMKRLDLERNAAQMNYQQFYWMCEHLNVVVVFISSTEAFRAAQRNCNHTQSN